ncbi:hypothetical protein CVU37_14595 [candidate division BRC1 bacterium HGW-BRC1-1]|nr:MAG: hypothetical protein CVU37_14595 [candidate division BRC1 bacterium HGW-BRC1-1]
MQKTLRYFSVAVIAAGLVAVAGAATPIYVNGATGLDTNDGVAPGTAVQTVAKGVELVDAGGEVIVAAGAYTEQVVLAKKVALKGANFGISPNPGTGRVAESIFTGNAPNVAFEAGSVDSSIDGFKFTGATNDAVNGAIKGSANGIVMKNNIIDAHSGHGVNATGVQNWTIEDNKISNIGGTSRSALFLISMQNSLIKNNVINTTVYAGIIVDSGQTLTLEGNTISNVTQPGIQVANSAGPVTVTKNTITNANTSNGVDKAAISIYANSLVVDVTLNTISGSNGAFSVRSSGTGTVASTVHVNNNDFLGNTSPQVKNRAPGGTTPALDATNNWWGVATGPAAADLAEAGVTLTPFLAVPSAVDGWSKY